MKEDSSSKGDKKRDQKDGTIVIGDEDKDEDPVTRAIANTGCLQLHYAVQDCMYEHRDWRQCQEQVNAFRQCIQQDDADKRRKKAPSGT